MSRSVVKCCLVLWIIPVTCFLMRKPKQIFTKYYLSNVDEVEGPLSVDLLKDYWGKKPILIRNGFDTNLLTDNIWPSWDYIVELACTAEEVDGMDPPGELARLIQHIPGQMDSFDAERGPFDKSFIETLGSDGRKWTLVMNDVDRFLPGVADWMDDEFGFLPRWRRDDAQVSIARKGGGIGPHVDSYDVFLVQTSGVREWLIGDRLISTKEEFDALIPTIPVRIVQGEYDTTKLILRSGDLLYLPPRVLHCGTSLSDDCITLSVGCRAPSAAELSARLAEVMADSINETIVRRYSGVDLLRGHPNMKGPSISREVKDSMKQLVLDAVSEVMEEEGTWDELVGSVCTEPKRYVDGILQRYEDIDDEDYFEVFGSSPEEAFESVILGQGVLIRAEGVSMASSKVEDKGKDERAITLNRLFVNGEMWEIDNEPKAEEIFKRIEKGQPLHYDCLVDISAKLRVFLINLISEGAIYASE